MIRQIVGVLFMAAMVFGGAPAAKANDYRIVVINNTSYTIYHIYAANRDEDVGPDVLGRYIIPPGDSMTIDVDDDSGYCIFNMRATSKSGDEEWTLSNFNACETTTWTLRD